MKVVAVIPAYNEGERIADSVRDAALFVSAVVVVDDCSRDATGAKARQAGAYVLTHVVNRGQGAALQTGTDFALRQLAADIIVHFDADGQMQGSDILPIITPIATGKVDVTLGSRYLGEVQNIPLARRLMHAMIPAFTFLFSGLWLTDTHCGFRAFSRSAAERVRITLDRMAHASEIPDQIAIQKLRYQEVPVTIRYTQETLAKSRAQGQSTSAAFRVAYDFMKGKFLR